MAKVNIKSEKITPFGGIYYASKVFYALSDGKKLVAEFVYRQKSKVFVKPDEQS